MLYPLLFALLPDLLLDPQGYRHLICIIVQNKKLMLVAWKVTGNPLRWKLFQVMQLSLYSSQEDWVLLHVTN